MNRRKWKKYANKDYCKSWYMSRYNKLRLEAIEYAIIFKDMSPFGIQIKIIDSKRGNLKHPLKIQIEKYAVELPMSENTLKLIGGSTT